MKFILIFLTFLALDCSNAEEVVNQEVEKVALDKLAQEIKAMVETSVCSSEFSCNFIGFGSKPCGGNWEYLVYSNSIDIADFISKVKTYNELEKEYNIKWKIISDCMLAMPPNGTTCKDGKCVALYN